MLNATRMSRGLITTTVPIGLPAKSSGAGFFPLPANVSGLSKPVSYIAGGMDLLLCPPAGIVDAYRLDPEHDPRPPDLRTVTGPDPTGPTPSPRNPCRPRHPEPSRPLRRSQPARAAAG